MHLPLEVTPLTSTLNRHPLLTFVEDAVRQGAPGWLRACRKGQGVPIKRVVTISDERLPVVSADLLSLVRRGGFEPDALVGVATGGVKVMQEMGAQGLPLFSCRLRRSTSQTKERAGGGRLLPRLPYAALNLMRVVEDWSGSRKPIARVETTDVLRAELDEVGTFVSGSGARRLLVVDDALDSGATLECVLRSLRQTLPSGVEVRSAVITQTRPPHARLVTADFRLYDLVLLRFPWSLDYKGYA